MTRRSPDRDVAIDRGDGCWRGRFYAMASPCEVLCKTDTAGQAKDLTELAATEVWRIEDKFSRYRDDNIIARINSADAVAVDVDSETAQLIDFSATLFELSDGKFDITSGVLRRIWTFDGGHEIPDRKVVQQVLELVGWSKVTWRDHRLQIEAGMQIDLGGVGKEYAVDRAATLLREATQVSCLVNLGGDLAVTRRTPDGRPWTVGIEGLNTTAELPASLLKLHVGALATSGDARRYLLKDGMRYSHILDARNGWPVADAPRSITVAADTCTQAGMLSTLGMLQGNAAESFLEEQGVDYWCER
jgi:thiamine biosynthesis lipoprotein